MRLLDWLARFDRINTKKNRAPSGAPGPAGAGTKENHMSQIPTNFQVVEAFCGSNVVQPKELQKNLEKAGWHVTAAIAGIARAIDNGAVTRTASGGLRVASPTP